MNELNESSNSSASAAELSTYQQHDPVVIPWIGIGASKLDVFRHVFGHYASDWEYNNQQWLSKSSRLVIMPCSGFDCIPGQVRRLDARPERDAYILVRVSKNKRSMQVLQRFILRNNNIADTEF